MIVNSHTLAIITMADSTIINLQQLPRSRGTMVTGKVLVVMVLVTMVLDWYYTGCHGTGRP